MWRKNFIFSQWFLGFVFSFILLSSYAQSQNTSDNNENYKLQSFFIKPELSVKSGELYFNVINIINPTGNPIQIKPFLNKPEGWSVYSTFIKDTIIQPGDTLRLPFRIKIAVNATSDIDHSVNFEAYSASNQLLTKSTCTIHTTPVHDWSVNVTSDRIFFYPRLNQAKFNVFVENKGNTPEAISLDYNIGRKIKLQNADGTEVNKEIFLPANTDTIISLIANYTYSEDRQFDLSRIQLNAATPENKMVRSLVIEKYKDTYNPLRLNDALPHRTELGLRFTSDGEEPEPYLNARGKTTFKNEDMFSYNFSNYDLKATNQFIENSFYNFLYTRKALEVGLGSFNSTLGRNLYSQNGIMFHNTIKMSKTGDLEVFADQDFLQPITSAAAGYFYHKNKLEMHGSAAYNLNQYTKKNTASVYLNSGTISLFRDHTVAANFYGFREDNYYAAKYFQMGVGWDINYFGWLGKQFSFQLINNYGSPNIPGSSQGLLNNGLRAYYYLGISEKYISATYFNTRRDYYYFFVTDTSAVKQPNIYLYNQYASLLYNNHLGKFFRWSAGPSAQLYKSEKPYNIQGDYQIYEINRASLELNTEIGNNLIFNIKGGYRQIYYKQIQEFTLNKYDLHLTTGFRKSGYGLSVNYHIGPLVNTGLYQTANDFDYNGIIINGSIFQAFFKKRVSLQVFANYMYRFDLDYGNIQITPKIETYIAKNWYIDLKGNYGYYMQNNSEFQGSRSVYYTEISIVKNWGKTDYLKWQKKLRRLKVILYQDDNGNGVKDNYEQGIPYVKTRLKLTVGSDQSTSGHFPVDIALLSNERGTVTFNQIPQGFYELEITPLADVGEYFYVNKTNKEIDIVKNTTIYIPFQKAAKIEGRIDVQRSKFIKEGSKKIDLSNIKVTAYNNSGNSYSSFTRGDGKFIIFVPGDTTYFVRMQNVFGSSFVQRQNDIEVKVPDSSNKLLVFEFVEFQREIKFKKAEPEVPDSLKIRPQKVKILEGKIFENAKSDTLRRNEVPDFNFENKKSQTQEMEVGKFYLILGITEDINEALLIKKIVDENGLKSQLGTVTGEEKYYIFSNEYSTRLEAETELELLKKGGNRKAYILKYK